MNPGDNCPDCDRRLTGDECKGCGWKATPAPGATAGARTCARCSMSDRSLLYQDGRFLCAGCRADLLRIHAASDEDLTDTGETVAQVRAKIREILRANAHKWESKRPGATLAI